MVKQPSNLKGSQQSLADTRDANMRTSVRTDVFVSQIAALLSDQPKPAKNFEIDGQTYELPAQEAPTADTVREVLRVVTFSARAAYDHHLKALQEPPNSFANDIRNWNRKPNAPVSEYRKRVRAARNALNNVLQLDFEHIPPPPDLRGNGPPENIEAQKRYYTDLWKDQSCYKSGAYEALKEANRYLSEIHNGLIKTKPRSGRPKDESLGAAAAIVHLCGVMLNSLLPEGILLPKRLLQDIHRAIWRDAGLRVPKGDGNDEDAWIDNQLKPFDKFPDK